MVQCRMGRRRGRDIGRYVARRGQADQEGRRAVNRFDGIKHGDAFDRQRPGCREGVGQSRLDRPVRLVVPDQHRIRLGQGRRNRRVRRQVGQRRHVSHQRSPHRHRMQRGHPGQRGYIGDLRAFQVDRTQIAQPGQRPQVADLCAAKIERTQFDKTHQRLNITHRRAVEAEEPQMRHARQRPDIPDSGAAKVQRLKRVQRCQRGNVLDLAHRQK